MPTPDDLAGIIWRKSSRSEGASGSCVEVGMWRKSSRSQGADGNCVEVGGAVDGSRRVAVRDTKDRIGPMLVFPAAEWSAFLAAIKSHTFDL